MARRRRFLVALLLVIAAAGSAGAQAVPSPLTGVAVSARVTRDASGKFQFEYRVTNPPHNAGALATLTVDVTRATDAATLPVDGLVNGPKYLRHSSEAAAGQVAMVPVGITGPEGWVYGLGYAVAPTGGFALWGSIDEPFNVAPGGTGTGFRLTSPALPGIRSSEVIPAINTDLLPPEFEDPDKVVTLRASLTIHTRTVGPTPPPATVVPVEFVNYLIALLHESRAQGWIRLDGLHQSLLAKLRAAKRHLGAGDPRTAGNVLRAFAHEVDATSCRDLACPGNRPLTSEAYAVLFFNAEFLLAQLP
jgi:hypothetical protein